MNYGGAAISIVGNMHCPAAGWFGLPPVTSRIRDGTALFIEGVRADDNEPISFLAVLTQIVCRKSVKGPRDLLRANAARNPQSIRLTVPRPPDCLLRTCNIVIFRIEVRASGSGCHALDALVSLLPLEPH